MELGDLAVTVVVLGVLGFIASRFGLSAIPAYLLAGLLLGPNEPEVLSLIEPSEVTSFVAEIGIVFLLFFLGLEFTLDRILRSGRHVVTGGIVDLGVNAGLGLIVGLAAFGPSFGALILAAAVYVSSSAVTVKGLIDFRRLADDETDLVLAILVFEDLAIAFVLGLAGGGGGELASTLVVVLKALLFVTASLAASRWLARPFDQLLDRLPREFFLLATFAFLIGMAALADALGLSEAIGALMAGVVLAGTGARAEIEERFFSFRDLFGALFFFVFGLSIDVGAIGSVWWVLVLAVALTVVGKDKRRLCRRPGRGLHTPAKPERRPRARGARRVHDRARAASSREPAHLRGCPVGHRCLRRALRARHGHHRHRPHEGVEASGLATLPAA